jgi:UDP-N-acetylglucosamine 4-epimerase
MIRDQEVIINGDGETSRDFTFIENVVQANLLASLAGPEGVNQVYNVAFNARTSLNQLFGHLRVVLGHNGIGYTHEPRHGDFRAGDVRHSQADVSKARHLLGYEPLFDILQGLEVAMPWYTQFLR